MLTLILSCAGGDGNGRDSIEPFEVVLGAPAAAGCRSLYGLGGPIEGTMMLLLFNRSLLDLVSSSGAVRVEHIDIMFTLKYINLQKTLTFVGLGGGIESCASIAINNEVLCMACVCVCVCVVCVCVCVRACVCVCVSAYRWPIGEINR